MTESAKRHQLIIFTEGKETEPLYLTEIYRRYRRLVIAKIAPHQGRTTPMELVNRAIGQRSQDRIDAKRGLGDAYDEYWCVFDVDRHPNLENALQLAASTEIQVALSNPCVELWLILHLEAQQSYLSTDQAEKMSEKILGCGKALTPTALERLMPFYDHAKERAQHLEKKHELDGSPRNCNPSSDVWRLVEVIRSAESG